jgi:hypothetical protein
VVKLNRSHAEGFSCCTLSGQGRNVYSSQLEVTGLNQAQSTIACSHVGQPGKYRLSGVTKESAWAK